MRESDLCRRVGSGGRGRVGLDQGEMHIVLVLPCCSVCRLSRFKDKARQATLAFFEVAMICMMDLAMSSASHFGLARCHTGLSAISTNTISQSAYTGKVNTYHMVFEYSSQISPSSEARVYDVVTCIA